MNDADLFKILANLSQSIQPVEHLITGFSYLAGIMLVMSALMKLKHTANSAGRPQESGFAAGALMAAGAALLFLPSTIHVVSNTIFGSTNILQYSKANPANILTSIKVILEFAGLIWFIRGSLMLVHAGQPGEERGLRGLLFIAAGIGAMNFTLMMGWASSVMTQLVNLSLTVKSESGF